MLLDSKRYILCLGLGQARKDPSDRKAIIGSLKEKIKANPKGLVGNKGYGKYPKIEKGSVSVDQGKIKRESRLDGKGELDGQYKAL